jgi:hypothetical protein
MQIQCHNDAQQGLHEWIVIGGLQLTEATLAQTSCYLHSLVCCCAVLAHPRR